MVTLANPFSGRCVLVQASRRGSRIDSKRIHPRRRAVLGLIYCYPLEAHLWHRVAQMDAKVQHTFRHYGTITHELRIPVRLPPMPTVLRRGLYRFFFYSNEGTEPPHVHVESGGSDAKFRLEPVSYAKSRRVAAHELTQVQLLVQEHRTEFLSAWNDYFGSR